MSGAKESCWYYANQSPMKYFDCMKCVGRPCPMCANPPNTGCKYPTPPTGLCRENFGAVNLKSSVPIDCSILKSNKPVILNMPIIKGTGYQTQFIKM